MRSVATIVIALLLSSACARKPAPPPTTAASPTPAAQPARPPSEASHRPFFWAIQVHEEHDANNYVPGPKPQSIPTPGSEWQCVHGGLQSNVDAEGDYVEVRDVMCRLASGHAVGGRTLCSRNPEGKVIEDTQLLAVGDGKTLLKIVVACSETDLHRTDRQPARQATPPPQEQPAPRSTPTFEQPKSIDI